jgi:hypothetical protein
VIHEVDFNQQQKVSDNDDDDIPTLLFYNVFILTANQRCHSGVVVMAVYQL